MKSDVTRLLRKLGIQSVIFIEQFILILQVMDWHAFLLRELHTSEIL